MAAAALAVAALASAPVLSAAAEPARGPEPAALVEQLRSPSYWERRRAETALRSLGRAALPAVEQRLAGEPDPEMRRRLTALAVALEGAEIAKLLAEPTRVTADYRDRPALEVVSDLCGRAGWRVKDNRSAAADEPRLTLSLRDAPLLEAISTACRRAGCTWRVRTDGVSLETAEAGRRAPEAFSGPFMARLTQVRLDYDLAAGRATAVWSLDLCWEPKVNVLAADQTAAGCAAWDAAGANLLRRNPPAAPKSLAQHARSASLTLVTAAPSAGVSRVDSLEFAAGLMVVGRTERLEIRPLDPSKSYSLTGKQSGIPVTVRPAQEVGSRWQVQIAVGQGESEIWQGLISQGIGLSPAFELLDSSDQPLATNSYWQGALVGEPVYHLYYYRIGESRPAALNIELPVSFHRHAARFRFEHLSTGE